MQTGDKNERHSDCHETLTEKGAKMIFLPWY